MNKSFASIVSATIVNNVIGFFWYSPSVFGATWARLSNVIIEGEMPFEPILYGLLLSVFVAVMLVRIVEKMKLDVNSAVSMAFMGWLTFTLPYGLQAIIYSAVSPTLIAINASYNLLSFVSMAAVISYMQQK